MNLRLRGKGPSSTPVYASPPEGLTLPPCRQCTTSRCLLLALLAIAFLSGLSAKADEESIILNMNVNYGVAYRDASWVPVDVMVHNSERDVSGSVEIRTYDFNGNLQSPIYRVPAESPRGSQKRFRVYCRLDRVDRIEARLFHGRRAVSPVPTWLQLTPIDRSDYLGLILDDAYHDYGFLSDRQVIGQSERRFHREGLASDQLASLADRLPCYTAFDLIVLGDIDPERIGMAQRALFLEYVMLGGTLAVNLGANADRYIGTWVEPLLGVSIGANQFLSEPALARAIWASAGDLEHVTENREGMVTTLMPAADGVRPLGDSYLAGSIHPVGNGRVVTFSTDAVSGLLQHEPAYLKFWNDLLLQSIVDRPLNLGAIVEAATQQLPRIAGVRLFPVSSVITYLLLYFFIAIVANWLFWNRMQRREMAWVCLVFFSIAFTSYAMIFGTQGRARSTQLEQLEILEVASNNAGATLHGITGLLAKGSGQFDANLIYPGTLVSDIASNRMSMDMQTAGFFGSQGQGPFQFIQSDPGQVTNLTVGASEMRFFQTETPITLDGPLEVRLQASEAGLDGTIHNKTGIPLANAIILRDGAIVSLEKDGDIYRIQSTGEESARSLHQGVYGLTQLAPGNVTIVAGQDEPGMAAEFRNFLSALPAMALNFSGRNTPPCLVAWIDGPPIGTVDMGRNAKLQLGATLLIAWLTIEDTRQFNGAPIDLPLYAVDTYGSDAFGNGYAMGTTSAPPARRIATRPFAADGHDWRHVSLAVRPEDELAYRLALPDWVRGRRDFQLEITVTTEPRLYEGLHGAGQCKPERDLTYQSGFNVPLVTVSDGKETPLLGSEPATRTFDLGPYDTLKQTTYRVTDWRRLLEPRSTTVSFGAHCRTDNGRPVYELVNQNYTRGRGQRHFHAHIRAQLIKTTPDSMGD